MGTTMRPSGQKFTKFRSVSSRVNLPFWEVKLPPMSDTLVVNEIYLSLQGESTFAGLPCVFVRLTACNLRCSYCDSAYAFSEGRKMSLSDVRAEVQRLAARFGRNDCTQEGGGTRRPLPLTRNGWNRLPLVELTGGEPL